MMYLDHGHQLLDKRGDFDIFLLTLSHLFKLLYILLFEPKFYFFCSLHQLSPSTLSHIRKPWKPFSKLPHHFAHFLLSYLY